MIKKILIIQITRLGDIIQSIPFLKEVMVKHPGYEIHMLVNKVFSDASCLLENINLIPVGIDKVISYDINKLQILKNEHYKQIIEEINSYNFEFVYNLNTSPLAKAIIEDSHIKHKNGFAGNNLKNIRWAAFINSFLKNRYLNTINLVDIFRGFIEKQDYCSLRANQSFIKKKAVALQCGARNIKRCFENRHYLDIAEYYLQCGYTVYLLGVETESNVAQKILIHFNFNKNLIDLTGKTSIAQLKNILSECERLFTPDTGTMHLAAFCNTPFIAYFCGPAYPYETLAYSENSDVIFPDKELLPCYPCQDDDRCINNYKCHSFSFSKYLKSGLISNGFIKTKAQFDLIGQALEINNHYANIWREFTKIFFFKQEIIKYDLSQIQKEKISRELKLFEFINEKNIDSKSSNINDFIENFEILNPLFYYRLMTDDTELINHALIFFKKIAEG